MLKRIITGIVAILILLPVLIFSETIVFPFAISFASIICLCEIFKCVGSLRRISLTAPAYLFAVAFPFLLRYMSNTVSVAIIGAICALLYLIYVFAHIIWSHSKLSFSDGLNTYTLSLYIIFALTAIVYIRDYQDIGQYIYFLIFLGAWITDIFAYFTGVFFGKHKLIEDVSPKKTIEGSIGGIFFCALSFVALGLITEHFFQRSANLLFLIVSGIIISIVSQIGDLIMSVIKRHYGIKDFGKLFPGHGGMLDRFDSILAVTLGMVCVCLFVSVTGIALI